MLGRLIYHEWKDTWKLMTILNGAVIVLSVLDCDYSSSFGTYRAFQSCMSPSTMYLVSKTVAHVTGSRV